MSNGLRFAHYGLAVNLTDNVHMRKKLLVSAAVIAAVGVVLQQIVSIPKSVASGITKGMNPAQGKKSFIFKNRVSKQDRNQQQVAQTVKNLNADTDN